MSGRGPTIARSAIKKLFDARSFERGAEYAQRRAIIDPRYTPITLAARCRGSAGHTYRVTVSFDSRGPASARCSCPVGGWCKHAAALLLTWIEHPDRFVELVPLDDRLKSRSRDELVMLIAQMLRQFPDAEALLDTPPPSPTSVVAPEDFEAQTAAAFERAEEDWSDGRGIELGDAVLAVAATGADFLDCGNPRAAAAVYEGVMRAIEHQLDEIPDLLNDLDDAIATCMTGLRRCLAAPAGAAAAADAEFREYVIGRLLAAVCADVESGYADAAEEAWAALIEDTTPQERTKLIERVERAARKARGPWSADAYADLLAALADPHRK